MTDLVTFDLGINTKLEKIPLPTDIETGVSKISTKGLKEITDNQKMVLEDYDLICRSAGNSSKNNKILKLDKLHEYLSYFDISGNYNKRGAIDKLISICENLRVAKDKEDEEVHKTVVGNKKSNSSAKKKQSMSDFM